MRLSETLVLASANRHKFDEFSYLLDPYPGIELVPAQALIRNTDKLELVETHDSYLENCLAKARLVAQACHFPVLADDSGLEVDALGGRPGVRSNRFVPTQVTGKRLSPIEYLLSQIPPSQTEITARFVCTVALLMEGISITATGTLEGTLIRTQKGNEGFGYDPIFVPKGHSRTLAEMSSNEKNDISHRAVALRALMDKLHKLGIVLAKT